MCSIPDTQHNDLSVESHAILLVLQRFYSQYSCPGESLSDCILRLIKTYHPDKQRLSAERRGGTQQRLTLNIQDIIDIRQKYKRLQRMGYDQLTLQSYMMSRCAAVPSRTIPSFSHNMPKKSQSPDEIKVINYVMLPAFLVWVWVTWWCHKIMLVMKKILPMESNAEESSSYSYKVERDIHIDLMSSEYDDFRRSRSKRSDTPPQCRKSYIR